MKYREISKKTCSAAVKRPLPILYVGMSEHIMDESRCIITPNTAHENL